MNRFFLPFALVLLFACFASAATINAPAEVPANANWSFFVQFDSLDFSEAKIFLDGTQITPVFAYNGILVILPNTSSPELVSNVAVSGSKAIVSMNGLANGEKLLALEVFKNSEKIESQSARIIVSDSLGADLKARMDSMQSTITSLASELNALKAKQEELANSISALQGLDPKISELNSQLQGISEKIRNIDGEIGMLISDIEGVRNPQGAQKFAGNEAGADANLEIAGNAPVPLFSLLNSGALALILGALVIVFAVLVGIKIARSGRVKIPSLGRKEVYNDYDKIIDGPGLKESIEEQKQGKWSFEQQPSKSKSRLSFSNLIRRR